MRRSFVLNIKNELLKVSTDKIFNLFDKIWINKWKNLKAKSLTEVKEEVMTKAKLKLDAIEKKLGAIEFANFAIANLTNVWDFVMQRNKIVRKNSEFFDFFF